MTLQGKTAQGVVWSAVSQWGRLGLNLLTTIILARLLAPGDFGLLAMCVVFTGLFASVSDLGLGSALVQAEAPGPEDFDTVFWLSAGTGILSCLAVTALAPLVASFYGVGDLTAILRWLGAGLAASSLAVVPQALLTRAMNFQRIAAVEITASLFGGGIGIAAALLGAGAFSLVMQSLGTAACATVGYWIAAPWKPGGGFAGFGQGRMIRFGTHLIGFNAVNYVARNVDYLLIGKYLGPEQLGYYSLAYRLMLFPLQNISAVVGKVLLPAFSAIQRDDRRLRDAFLRLTRYVALLSFPLMLGVLVTAHELIGVVFGARWDPAAPVVQILALVGLLQSIGTNTGTLFMAKGRTDILFRWGICATAVLICGIVWGLAHGILGVATGYALAYLLLVIPGLAIPLRLVDGRAADVLRAVLPVFLLSAAAAACVVVLRVLQDALISLPAAAVLGLSAAAMAGVYIVLVSRFMADTAAEVRALFRNGIAASE